MSFALITGASKGIGKSFAMLLANKKYDLLLVARSAEELQQVCIEIADRYQVSCNYLAIDLSDREAAGKLYEWVANNGYKVSILINNAGYGLWGSFHDLSLDEQNEMMVVNMVSLVNLTHRMLPQLMQQEKAYILNVSSTTAYQAVPTMNIYAASKSFVLLFTRALRYELKHTSVSVSCLSPGGTKTNFVQRAKMPHMQKISDRMSMEPDDVAATALRGMFAGKAEIIPGLVNKIGAVSASLMPKALVEKIAAGLYVKKEK